MEESIPHLPSSPLLRSFRLPLRGQKVGRMVNAPVHGWRYSRYVYRIHGTAHRSIARVSWDYYLGCRSSRTIGPSTMARSQGPQLSVSRNGE